MKPLALTCAVLLFCSTTYALADPPDPNSATAKESSGASSALRSTPEREAMSGQKAATAPRGDLVELAKHPQAELLLSVELDGADEKRRYDIHASTTDALLLTCYGRCRFRIWPGRYRLKTRSKGGSLEGTQTILLDQDSQIVVGKAQLGRTIVGVTLALAGAAAFGLGAYFYKTADCGDECDDNAVARSRMGFGLMLGGAVAVPVGAGVLTFGLSPELSVTPMNFANATLQPPSKISRRGLSVAVTF